MKRFLYFLTSMAAVAALAYACVPEDGASEETFSIDENDLLLGVDQYSQVHFIPVESNIPESNWKFSSSADWLTISYNVGSERGLMISIQENESMEHSRRAQVAVGAGGKQYRIDVTQTGKGPSLVVYPVNLTDDAAVVTLRIVANIPFSLGAPIIDPTDNDTEDSDWLTSLSVNKALAETRYTYSVEKNTSPESRIARIPIHKGPYETELDEWQKELEAKLPDTIRLEQRRVKVGGAILDNKKISIASVTGNQITKNDGSVSFANLIDGDYTTGYHSPWGKDYENPTTQFPVIFEFKLSEPSTVESMKIMSSKAWDSETETVVGNGANGDIGEFEVYYRTAADTTYILAGEGDFGMAPGYNQFLFQELAMDAAYIKLVVKSGAGDNGEKGGFVSAAEVEFWQSNSDDLKGDILEMFEDLSCSEFRKDKPVPSKEAIKELYVKCPALAVNVASALKSGSYDEFEKEFRIRRHGAYSDNVAMHRELWTKTYTAMDNPTGILVKSGEEVAVAVDRIPAGQTVKIAIYGDYGEEPNYGGGGEGEGANQIVGLREGINAFTASANGMLYVLNTSKDLTQYHDSVKVHVFPGAGTVLGFFDAKTMTDERYVELLKNCTWTYFTIKGERVMFTFHTDQLKKDARDGILSGINAWDSIITWQHQLMGIADDPRFNNHMMAISSTGSGYMDASTRRIRFVCSSLENIISEEALKSREDNSWGPAHEAGHNNQAAINWKSTMESSNNLFSNYAIYKWGVYQSRGGRISDIADNYAAHKPWAMYGREGEVSYQNEDPEVHMRMNWQLWNYYHRCGYDTQFFPKLFKLLRTDEWCLHNDFWASEQKKGATGREEDLGLSQLRYYQAVCEAAQTDLTEFFKVWGFFEEYDEPDYEQYGKCSYLVTKEMIETAIAAVSARNYPNKIPPIQYIEDRKTKDGSTYSEMGYWESFLPENKLSNNPTAKVNGSLVTVYNCEKAVAVELREGTDAKGELLFFSNRTNFLLPDGIKKEGNTLWAVKYDGERIKIQ